MAATKNLPLTRHAPRVLELGSRVSASYAAKLLGDDGADVIKVEEPEGDATRRRGPFPNDQANAEKSGLFLALNVNKRGACLDLRSAAGRQDLERLVAWSDILVHNYPRLRADALGLNPNVLQEKHPDLVVLSITPFGIAGPYRDYHATELIVANAGGWAGPCPATHPEIDLPPLKIFGHQCAMMTATAGAMAALAALPEARRSGIGEHIDLSEQAYVAGVLEGAIPTYAHRDLVLKRNHRRSLIPWRMFQTKDGPIFLMCAEPDQWERLVDFMGRPDWTQPEVFADLEGRAENQDMVHQFVLEFVGQWNALDFYHAAQKHRICVAPIQQYADFAANKHLRAREFFETADQPDTGPVEQLASPILTTAGRPPIRRPAPRLGEHNGVVDARQARPAPEHNGKPRPPLEGVRVVDLTWVWAGTFGAMNLAHLGAEVICLESVDRADMYRRLGPRPNNAPPDLDSSGMFNQWNQGKKSVAVDLRNPSGIDIAKDFVRISDVIMQNFGTGVMERLGLGYDVLRQVNPRIILASISGYGQSGPHRNYISYGPSISPLDGICAVTGYIGGQPEELGVSMPNPNAGITAALAVVSALARLDQTGSGDHLDISLLESSAVFWRGSLDAICLQRLSAGTLGQSGSLDVAPRPLPLSRRGRVGRHCLRGGRRVARVGRHDPTGARRRCPLCVTGLPQGERRRVGGYRGGLDAGSGPLADHVTTSSGGHRSLSHFHQPGYRRRSASERAGDYRAPAARPRRRTSPYGHSLALFKARQRRSFPRALPRRGPGCAARRSARL